MCNTVEYRKSLLFGKNLDQPKTANQTINLARVLRIKPTKVQPQKGVDGTLHISALKNDCLIT